MTPVLAQVASAQKVPIIGIPCYINGDGLHTDNTIPTGFTSFPDETPYDAFVLVRYEPGQGVNSLGGMSDVYHLAYAEEIGSTWGVAYNSNTNFFYAGAVLKRHSALPPDGAGAIYKIEAAVDAAGTRVSTPSLLIDLNTVAGINTGGIASARNLAGTGNVWGGLGTTRTTGPDEDPDAFPAVGKIALGDVEITSDNNTLYVINLNGDGITTFPQLIRIDVTNQDAPVVTGIYDISPTTTGVTPVNGVLRPWGIGIRESDDAVFIGVVASGENSGTTNDLEGYVFEVTPTGMNTATFTNRLTVDLSYARGPTTLSPGAASPPGGDITTFNPWTDTYPINASTVGFDHYPQPIFSDIEFLDDGDLLVAVMDRWGMQTGTNNNPVGGGSVDEFGRPAGDVLRFSPDGTSGNWDGTTFTEYGDVMSTNENKVALGAIAYTSSSPGEFIGPTVDPIGTNNNGLSVMDLNSSAKLDDQILVNATVPGNNSPGDKGLALGDLELGELCIGIADLNLVKAVSNATPNVGDVVTFTITLSNEGPDAATNVSVEDILPNGYSYTTASINSNALTSGATITPDDGSAPTLSWAIDNLPNGESVELTFTAQVLVPGTGVDYVNVAEVTASDQFDPDSEPDNGADSNNSGDGMIGSQDNDGTQDAGDEDDGDDAVVMPISIDFGDLPDVAGGTGTGDYQTLAANGGPSHIIVSDLRIGATVDSELDGQPNASADGDDNNGADEDGVTFPATMTAGSSIAVTVNVTNNTGTTANLYGWIDFNNNGQLEAGERASVLNVPAGTNNVTLTFTAGQTTGATLDTDLGARFRLSTDAAAANPTGAADDGEVEDYLIQLQSGCPNLGPITFSTSPICENETFTVTVEHDAGAGDIEIVYGAAGLDMTQIYAIPNANVLTTLTPNPAATAVSTMSGNLSLPVGTHTLYARLTTDNPNYSATAPVCQPTAASATQITVNAQPTANPVTLALCDVGGDGQQRFDLNALLDGSSPVNTSNVAVDNGGGHTVTFHTSSPANAGNQIATGLVLTGIIDGPLAGGEPKAIELYATSDIADLSIYGIGNANNGGGSDGEEFSLSGSATAGQYLYIANDAADFQTYFGFAADFTSSVANQNGNDAIELYENGVVIDIYGDVSYTGTPSWVFTNRWVYRTTNTGPDGTIYVADNWTFAPANLSGATNATANYSMPIGSYQGLGSYLASDNATITALVTNADGCSQEATITFDLLDCLDFGDLPDDNTAATYATDATAGTGQGVGPSHIIDPTIFIGTIVDDESDGAPNATATGDDNAAGTNVTNGGSTDDEDGFTAPTFTAGQTANFSIPVFNNSGADAELYAWFDWNANGQLEAGERYQPVSVNDGAATNTGSTIGSIGNNQTANFEVAVPAGATVGSDLGVRFRLSTDAAAENPTGAATDGEVEDYLIQVENPANLSLGNLVWLDLDNDGIKDANEDGFDGVTVNLYVDAGNDGTPDGAAIATQTTMNGGMYLFENLSPNNYIVEVIPPAGYNSSTGTDGTTGTYENTAPDPDLNNDPNNDDNGEENGGVIRSAPVTLTVNGEPTDDGDGSNNTNLAVDFGLIGYNLGNVVFYDENNNGQRDAGEDGIQGVTLELLDADNSDAAVNEPGTSSAYTVTTDADGEYLFEGIPAGNYKVRIASSEFGSGETLENYLVSSGAAQQDDPETMVSNEYIDEDANGIVPNNPADAASNGVVSGVIAIGAGFIEPVDEDPQDPNVPGTGGVTFPDQRSNMTLDFGVYQADFGDLPNNGAAVGTDYAVATADNGPSHVIIDGLRIGNNIDAELDGQASSDALGDDSNGDTPDDEDGVDFTNITILPGNVVRIPVVVTNETGSTASFYAFIDWNNDGIFEVSEGEVAVTNSIGSMAGPQTLLVEFNVPTDADGLAIQQSIGARFRLSTDTGLDANGPASNGEVEDYLITTIPCPVGNCFDVQIVTNN